MPGTDAEPREFEEALTSEIGERTVAEILARRQQHRPRAVQHVRIKARESRQFCGQHGIGIIAFHVRVNGRMRLRGLDVPRLWSPRQRHERQVVGRRLGLLIRSRPARLGLGVFGGASRLDVFDDDPQQIRLRGGKRLGVGQGASPENHECDGERTARCDRHGEPPVQLTCGRRGARAGRGSGPSGARRGRAEDTPSSSVTSTTGAAGRGYFTLPSRIS